MSHPAFDPDDPRLTAYALGECSAAERAAVDQLLATSPEARAEVEQIGALALALEAEYHHENEAYQAAPRIERNPRKIVAFPAARRTGWNPTGASVWKIAAVVVALGAVLPFVLRQSSTPPAATLASSQPAGMISPPAPVALPSVEATPANSGIAQALPGADTNSERPSAAPPVTGVSPTPEDTDALLAMDSDRSQRDDTAARSAALPAAPSFQNSRVSVRREASAPEADRPGASSAATGAGAPSLADQIARSVVRIRVGDGSYIGGVLVTTDGRVLAAAALPGDRRRPTVLLADRRQVSVATSWDEADTGLCGVRISGNAFPAVALATAAPVDKDALTVASTNRHTGLTRFLRAQTAVSGTETRIRWEGQSPGGEDTNLAFNSKGELLVMEASPLAARTDTRAKSTSVRAVPAGPLVRPFSSAERALLQPAAKP